jgi:hypothetical protein
MAILAAYLNANNAPEIHEEHGPGGWIISLFPICPKTHRGLPPVFVGQKRKGSRLLSEDIDQARVFSYRHAIMVLDEFDCLRDRLSLRRLEFVPAPKALEQITPEI